ncbi:DHH family phosphoesterase [Trinickia sp. LjRoot230]|uniref:hypothetical protein n=1 Tax=Trinickia sp. LjRoot230 TaxID=3342288 RepID=UPI003ED0672C
MLRAETQPASAAYDVFNGDADGICALHQLRLACPREAVLVTGVKRDIALLQRVPCASGTAVTVLDISLDANYAPLVALLDAGAHVTYYDHHAANRAFAHPGLRLRWDDAPDTCTSLIVDRELKGRFRRWAIVAAFGDNLDARAYALAAESGCLAHETDTLAALGRALNYNAYGENIADLHVPSERLYRELHAYDAPLAFIAHAACYRALADGYQSDTAQAASITPHHRFDGGAVYVLPNAGWARRVSGVFANGLVQREPGKSFAVLTELGNGAYTASIRSGDPALLPANAFCERFANGGGRRAAAGINGLPASEVEAFCQAFRRCAGDQAVSLHHTIRNER